MTGAQTLLQLFNPLISRTCEMVTKTIFDMLGVPNGSTLQPNVVT